MKKLWNMKETEITIAIEALGTTPYRDWRTLK